ncbi:MAG: hypothetical protein IKY76_03940 [Alistipes sp.]|nr:hypothetical protein [Alistipes sp.]
MLSFVEYASEKRILELLIKERAKVAVKGTLKKVSPDNREKRVNKAEKLPIAEHISLLMPPRDSWVRPRFRNRRNSSEKAESIRKHTLTRSIALTIIKHRKSGESHPYLERLDAYIKSLQADIASNKPLKFRSLKIVRKKKKEVKIDGENIIIYRPICTFTSMREKLLISLACKYLSDVFDPYLHEEILSYRPLRKYHDSEKPIQTNRDNAIENLQAYRRKFSNRAIYVAECDIQKYYDTINHDVVRECLGNMAERVKQEHPDFDFMGVSRIIEAYLNSYSFEANIESLNRKFKKTGEASRFESPKRELLIKYCYTEQEYKASIRKIGIPQGGALSGLISNVIMNTIDRESVLTEPDGNRFFCRYGDDILLLHTSKERCQQLINSYRDTLNKYKLLHHEFISVGDPEFRREDGSMRTCLWDQKSRNPFLWGRSHIEKDAADWIGFLGYEVRSTGEVRLRRSSLDDKFKGIKRKYCSGAKTRLAKGTKEFKDSEALQKAISDRIDKFKGDGLAAAKNLTRNKYSLTQAAKLNRYTRKWVFRLLYKIARHNNLTRDDLGRLWRSAQERNCFNYTATISRPHQK